MAKYYCTDQAKNLRYCSADDEKRPIRILLGEASEAELKKLFHENPAMRRHIHGEFDTRYMDELKGKLPREEHPGIEKPSTSTRKRRKKKEQPTASGDTPE